TSCGPICSGLGYATQCAASASCPPSDHFVCLNSAFSRHFWTMYGSYVQYMDAQLGARLALPVLARTVSGFVNSPFLNHFHTFYGPSVQTMDTQLGARQGRRAPTIHRDRAQRFE